MKSISWGGSAFIVPNDEAGETDKSESVTGMGIPVQELFRPGFLMR
jgi:hypothetical protein